MQNTRKTLVWADDDALLDGFKFAWGWLQPPGTVVQGVTTDGYWLYIEDDGHDPKDRTFELDADFGLRLLDYSAAMSCRDGRPVLPFAGRPKRSVETVAVSGLRGRALDWAVAKARGVEFTDENAPYPHELANADWIVVGAIIEEYGIDLTYDEYPETDEDRWNATNKRGHSYQGETARLAVLRAFVGIDSGNTINVPSELLK